MSTDPPGFELALRLLMGFRVLIDGLHERLALGGHPDVRPVHGFVLQAIGAGGDTAVDLGRRLGMSKQAAAKHVEFLEGHGYLERTADAHDARRRLVRLTDRGADCLHQSAMIFDDLRAGWAATLGPDRLREVESALQIVTPAELFRLDTPGWLGGA